MSMIIDRTIEDVRNAKNIYDTKITRELTEDDIFILERGMLTINAINRIEDKQAEIKSKLDEMGYLNTPIINKTWGNEDIFIMADLERLCNNNKALHDAFYALKESPLDAIPEYYYTEINALEKILVDISKNIEYTIENYRRCGTFNCGG